MAMTTAPRVRQGTITQGWCKLGNLDAIVSAVHVAAIAEYLLAHGSILELFDQSTAPSTRCSPRPTLLTPFFLRAMLLGAIFFSPSFIFSALAACGESLERRGRAWMLSRPGRCTC
jgi:hypothetical protein